MPVPLASNSTAAAATETHCVVGGLRYADALQTMPLPRLRHGRTSDCGLSGRAAHPLSAPVVRTGTAAAESGEQPAFRAVRGGGTGQGAAMGITRRSEMDMVAVSLGRAGGFAGAGSLTGG